MDAGLVGVLAAGAAVAVGFFALRPRKPVPLAEVLDAMDRINNDPQITAIQKRTALEQAWKQVERREVSVVGRVEDIFPNRSAVIQTPLAQLPWIGFDFAGIKDAELHAIAKGQAMTLRASLAPWKKFTAMNDPVEALGNARVFYRRHWYGVKDLYRARLNPPTQASKP